MDSHSKKILITGSNGFTGKYLSSFFTSKGHIVYGISNKKETNDNFIFECDLIDAEKLTQIVSEVKPNIVIHLAAISFVGHPDIGEMYSTNIIGTKNLLESIKQEQSNSIEKIILASSATVYGNQAETHLDESLCPNPVNHYGISKLAMEQVAKMYFDQLPILITRPFNYTAPTQNINFVIPKIIHAFKNKLPFLELGNIDVYREYNSIEFICECYYKLSMSNFKSEVVNLCSGITHSLNEVLTICSEISNHKLEVKINQDFVRKNEIHTLSGNPEKLNKLIKINDEDYSIERTLKSFF